MTAPEPRRITVADGGWVIVGGATIAEQDQIIADLQAVAAARVRRRRFLADAEQAWASAKDVGQDHLDGIPPPPTGNATLAVHTQQIMYLFDRIQEITRWIVGGGTITTPGIGDVVLILAKVLNEVVESDDDVTPP